MVIDERARQVVAGLVAALMALSLVGMCVIWRGGRRYAILLALPNRLMFKSGAGNRLFVQMAFALILNGQPLASRPKDLTP